MYRTVRNVCSVRANLFFFILAVPSQVHNTLAYLMRSAGAHPPFTPFTFCLVDYKLEKPFSDISYTADKRWDEKYFIFCISYIKISYFQSNVGKLQPFTYSSYFMTSSGWNKATRLRSKIVQLLLKKLLYYGLKIGVKYPLENAWMFLLDLHIFIHRIYTYFHGRGLKIFIILFLYLYMNYKKQVIYSKNMIK